MYILLTKRQTIGLLAGVMAAVIALTAVIINRPSATPTAAAIGSWGLSFRQDGQPPVGNATAAELAQYDAYYIGDTNQKTIYITFDAGYENGHTAAILDALKKHHVQAAFFVVGHYLESAPDLVKRMVAEGHTVGNHTYHHPDMSAIADEAAFKRELTATEEAYEAIIGAPMPKLYRPPQGNYSVDNLRMAKSLGYKTLFWSLAYVDWNNDSQPTPQQAFDKLIPRIHNGAVVLLHSTSATNANILDELLTKWENLGYSFGSPNDLCSV